MRDTAPTLGVHQECEVCGKPRWAHRKEVMCNEAGYELIRRCEHGAHVRIIDNNEAISLLEEFAAKVATWLSFRHGESYEGQDLELDELFALCEKYAPTEER